MALDLRLDVAFVGPTDNSSRREEIAEARRMLANRRLSSEFVETSATLFDALARLQPQVIVLDYFLDQYGTAVDLLSNSTILESSRVVLWCDEPSLDVAVTTMKLGASDYILSTASRSLELLVEAIRPLIRHEQIRAKNGPQEERFIAQDPAMRAVLASAEAVALQDEVTAVLFGASGSGRSSLAREIHRRRRNPGPFLEVDWELEVSKSPFWNFDVFVADEQSENATILLEHLDGDSGELVDEIERARADLHERGILLLLGVRSQHFLTLCERLLPDTTVCKIPSLAERSDDLLPLLRKTIPDMMFRELALDASDLEKIASFSWSGNLRQFLSCAQEAAFLLRVKERGAGASFFTLLRDAHDAWEQRHLAVASRRPTAIAVYRAYCMAGCSARRAAAMLNTDVRHVGRILAQLTTRQPQQERSR